MEERNPATNGQGAPQESPEGLQGTPAHTPDPQAPGHDDPDEVTAPGRQAGEEWSPTQRPDDPAAAPRRERHEPGAPRKDIGRQAGERRAEERGADVRPRRDPNEDDAE